MIIGELVSCLPSTDFPHSSTSMKQIISSGDQSVELLIQENKAGGQCDDASPEELIGAIIANTRPDSAPVLAEPTDTGRIHRLVPGNSVHAHHRCHRTLIISSLVSPSILQCLKTFFFFPLSYPILTDIHAEPLQWGHVSSFHYYGFSPPPCPRDMCHEFGMVLS